MFHGLVAIYIVLIVAMIVCIGIVGRSNTSNRMGMMNLIVMGVITAAAYLFSILIPDGYEHLAVFLNGVYFIATDWLAIVLMTFIADYTRIHPRTKLPRRLLMLLAVVDSVSLVVNTFTHHLYTMQWTTTGWAPHWQIDYAPLQFVHLAFVYLMVAYSILLLLYRVVKAPRLYKTKFIAILGQLALVILLNMVCVTMATVFDYSVLIYGLLAMSLSYYVLYATPKRLVERMHSSLAADSVIGLIVYDDDKHCVSVNKAARELFADEDDIHAFAEKYLAKWEEEYKGELKCVMGAERKMIKDNQTVYLYVNYQILKDEKGKVLGYDFQFEDRTEMVKRYKEEQYRATHDKLTGLFNRAAFEDEVRRILASAKEPYYMICSNIKDFKLINELCGTEVGDDLLIAQANVIRTEEFGESVSARMYADRFCTLMPKRQFDENNFKGNMASTMGKALSIPLKTHFYFGIYEIQDKNESVWTMCDKAMMAIDTIRGSYSESFSFYRDEMFQRIIKEKEILGEFDEAIAQGQFHMFLQPQIANDGTVVGAEALVRWLHPERGVISPADFIPVLEKAGLIHELDLYMWEMAAQKLEQWKKEGKENLSISVNISTKDFYLIDIYAAFQEISKKYDFDIKNLKLEITESALMRDVREIMQKMDELHGLGYDIEIDDFGSGYSSLGMLKDINADILKIDMIFLQETQNVERSETILKNVISMSKELGMPVITEGVETKEQLDFLHAAGCDMFQGYYFAKPMKVEEFEEQFATPTG